MWGAICRGGVLAFGALFLAGLVLLVLMRQQDRTAAFWLMGVGVAGVVSLLILDCRRPDPEVDRLIDRSIGRSDGGAKGWGGAGGAGGAAQQSGSQPNHLVNLTTIRM